MPLVTKSPLLLASLLAMLLIAGCGDGPATPEPVTDPSVPQIDWNDPGVIAELPGGWTVHACEGDALLLCVESDGEYVGSVELMSYPVSSFTDLDPNGPTGDNLLILADGFIEALAADRAAGCGADYVFTQIEPSAFELGEGGMAYGFEGSMADGRPSELNLQYSTIVDEMVVSVVAAAYDEGGCPGRDDLSGFDSVTLAEFRPQLERLLAGNPLPPDLIGA